jgi:hypothetical protein
MTESKWTSQFVKSLRQHPGFVVLKHSDRFTAGVPDISVTYRDRTLWLEVKKNKQSRRPKVQQRILQMLNGYYIFADEAEVYTADMDCVSFQPTHWVVKRLTA